MNTVLSGTLDRPEKAEIALIATMVMPYLILAGVKTVTMDPSRRPSGDEEKVEEKSRRIQ